MANKLQHSRNSNGAGTIYYQEKYKRYRGELRWTDNNGAKHSKKFTATKKSEVKHKLDEFKRKLLLQSGDISDSDITFKEYAEYWLQNTLCNKLKPSNFTH